MMVVVKTDVELNRKEKSECIYYDYKLIWFITLHYSIGYWVDSEHECLWKSNICGKVIELVFDSG